MTVVRRVALLATFAVLAAVPATALGHGRWSPAAHHSLRQPVTDQDFYL
jgi:hypothetical protein